MRRRLPRSIEFIVGDDSRLRPSEIVLGKKAARRKLSVWTKSLFVLIILSACGCSSTTPRQCQVINRAAVLQLNDWQQVYKIVASCGTQEQMLGGGYSFLSGF